MLSQSYITSKYNKIPMEKLCKFYANMTKALCGMLKSALWFYKKLKVDQENYGFTVSTYDHCVTNVMVNGKQMAATWYVDDLKVTHEDIVEVMKFTNYLVVIYGKKLTVHKRKVDNYLDIDRDYTRGGKVRIGMIKYLSSILAVFFSIS